jgi:hypothetical protein
MASRKQTPDILAEILGGETPEMPPPAKAAPPKAKRTAPRQAAAPKRTSETAAPPASKWEYQVVTFQDHRGWLPRFINGKETPDWINGPALDIYLAQLGDQGWELVAASSGERMYGAGDRLQLFFKRRK